MKSEEDRLVAFDVTGHMGVPLIQKYSSIELLHSNDTKQEASGVTDNSCFMFMTVPYSFVLFNPTVMVVKYS